MSKLPMKFKQAQEQLVQIPLNWITGNDANFRSVIPELTKQKYVIFPEKDAPEDHVIWHMLVGKPGEKPNPEMQAFAIRLIEEFESTLVEASDSIISVGVLEPVSVVSKGRYVGEAVKLEFGMMRCLSKAYAWAKNPKIENFIIGFLNDSRSANESRLRAINENLHRLIPRSIELARAIKILRDVGKMTPPKIAKRIGCSDETVRNYLMIADAPSEIQEKVESKELNLTKARELIELTSQEASLEPQELEFSNNSKGGSRQRKLKPLSADKILLILYDEEDVHTFEVICQILKIDIDTGRKMKMDYEAEQIAANWESAAEE